MSLMSAAQPASRAITEKSAREQIVASHHAMSSVAKIAPFREGDGKRYEGIAPWRDIPVSVILPVLEFNKTLPLVLEAIRLQTVPCVVYIIDTGSVLTTQQIEALRSPRTEVIQLRMQGWFHTSWPVAAALDAAWGVINTPFAFLTHDDCFLKQQTAFEQLISLTAKHHAVGHQITPREYDLWSSDFGHTMLMLDVARMDELPLTWNMRAYSHQTGVSIDPQLCKMGYPDTETMMNHQLRKAGLAPSFDAIDGQPLFTGTERNFERNENDWFDHCRSMTCGFLYSPEHAAKASEWADDAMQNAELRHQEWRKVIAESHPQRHHDWAYVSEGNDQ